MRSCRRLISPRGSPARPNPATGTCSCSTGRCPASDCASTGRARKRGSCRLGPGIRVGLGDQRRHAGQEGRAPGVCVRVLPDGEPPVRRREVRPGLDPEQKRRCLQAHRASLRRPCRAIAGVAPHAGPGAGAPHRLRVRCLAATHRRTRRSAVLSARPMRPEAAQRPPGPRIALCHASVRRRLPPAGPEHHDDAAHDVAVGRGVDHAACPRREKSVRSRETRGLRAGPRVGGAGKPALRPCGNDALAAATGGRPATALTDMGICQQVAF